MTVFPACLRDICSTCGVFGGVTTGAPATAAAAASCSHWSSPCLHTMNTLTSGPHERWTHREEGKLNPTAAAGRGDCFSSPRQNGEPVAVAPGVPAERKEQMVAGLHSPAGQVSPISYHLHLLSTLFPLHSAPVLTPAISHPATRAPHSSLSSSSYNYGDRVALSAKLGPLGSQQHIVQPD